MDEYGIMLVQRMIPCSTCAMNVKDIELPNNCTDLEQLTKMSGLVRDPELVKQFPLTVCAKAALYYDQFQCILHPDLPVSLVHMVPDLLLSDLPPSMVLDNTKFDFEANDETKLGAGGAGEVYKALYDGVPIAVKKFHSTASSRYSSCPIIL